MKEEQKPKKDPIEAMKAKLRNAEYLARLAPPYSAALLKALELAKQPKRADK